MTVKSQVVPKSTKVENIYSLCLKVLVFKNYFFFKIYINFFLHKTFSKKNSKNSQKPNLCGKKKLIKVKKPAQNFLEIVISPAGTILVSSVREIRINSKII